MLFRSILDWNKNFFPLEYSPQYLAQVQAESVKPEDYQNIINQKGLVFIDFFANWCAPCKEMAPMIEELKVEYEGKVKICKINSEFSKELLQYASVTSVPYLLLFKDGKMIFSKNASVTKEELKALFDQNL